MKNDMIKEGRNTTAITNPKTKSQDTTANTTVKGGKMSSNSNSKCNTEFAREMCQLNDADIASDVLSTQKSLIKMYGTAWTEVDCENFRGIIKSHMSECAQDQLDTFLYLNERGIYPTEDAPKPKIKEAMQRFAALEKNFSR